MDGNRTRPPLLKTWFIASRPWSWPASIVPVLFGTALAVVVDGAGFRPGVFLAALAAMLILHSGANILSDAADLEKGLDKIGKVTPVTGAVARGWLSPAQARRGALLFLATGTIIGLGLVLTCGGAVLVVGLAGTIIGYVYTQLKYNALGDLAVFLNFGPLATAGAIGILHANNWRDMATDKAGGILTMAGLLGDASSMIYYCLLLGMPFVFVTAGVVLSRVWTVPLPWSMLVVFLALPMAVDRMKKAARRANPASPLDFVILDGATAQLNMIFGLLLTAGLVLGLWL